MAERIPDVSWTWAEGRFFDLWMLVHLVSGVAGGFSNSLFQLAPIEVLVHALALMVLWEVGEYLVGIGESWNNRVLDVAVGMLGTVLSLVLQARMSVHEARVWYAATTTLALTLLAFGNRAYRARTRG